MKLEPKHWTESPCEHVWVLEPGEVAFCRLCRIDRPEVRSAQAKRKPAPARLARMPRVYEVGRAQ